tara:strand:- start:39 stop:290 length:252 start_codon:yes stop_codon:yes gene_type:complete
MDKWMQEQYEKAMKQNERYRQEFETLKDAQCIVKNLLKPDSNYWEYIDAERFLYSTLIDGLGMIIEEMDININGYKMKDEEEA